MMSYEKIYTIHAILAHDEQYVWKERFWQFGEINIWVCLLLHVDQRCTFIPYAREKVSDRLLVISSWRLTQQCLVSVCDLVSTRARMCIPLFSLVVNGATGVSFLLMQVLYLFLILPVVEKNKLYRPIVYTYFFKRINTQYC